MGSQICSKRGRNPQERQSESSRTLSGKLHTSLQRVYRDLQPSGERTEGASAQRLAGLLKAEKGRVGLGRPEAGRGRPYHLDLRGLRALPRHPAELWAGGGTQQQAAFLPLAPPGPFSGEKRNYVGVWGFQEDPKDQWCSGPGALYPAVPWAPEKYWQPWLTELFFRFEPAPPFDSDPAGQGKHFPASPAQQPRGDGAAVCCSEPPSPLPATAKHPPHGLGVQGGFYGRGAAPLLKCPIPGVLEDLGETWSTNTCFRHQNRKRKMLGKNLLLPKGA